MATEAQINANRANAQHSTGPSSPEGKLIASHNAVKNGLTGRTVLLRTIPFLEGAIWSLGRSEFAEECAHIEDLGQRGLHVEALVMAKYKSEFGNLTLQDNRIRRTLEKLNCELHNLQAERSALEQMRRKRPPVTT